MRQLLLGLSLAATIAATVGIAQTADVTLCRGLADAIRSIPANDWRRQDPLEALLQRARPYLQTAGKPELSHYGADEAERNRFAAVLTSRFRWSPELARAIGDLTEHGLELFSLPDSALHVAVNTGGSAHCQSFVFFQTLAGRPSQLVPEPIKRGQDSMDFCYNDAGYLGRVNGVDAFIRYTAGVTSLDAKFEIVPWRNGRWSTACQVEVDFQPEFVVDKVDVAPQSSLNRTTVAEVAVNIVTRRASLKDGDAFSYGPAVAERDKPGLERMMKLADDLSSGVQTNDGELHPLVLNGTTYVMLLGHTAIGWRDYPDWILVLYGARNESLEQVASVSIPQRRASLKSVRVSGAR